MNKRTPFPEIPSLDGIRAISVLIVLFAHCGFGSVVPGGLGVTIFFFLSGYLITTLLLFEHRETGTISIKHFYLRRLFRLAPPLMVTLCVAYLLLWLGLQSGGASIIGVLSQVFYLANYRILYFDLTYPVPVGTGILWSLAVEEHFYIVYPVTLFLLIRHGTRARAAGVLAGLCVATLLWRYHLATSPAFFPNRIYYASDTRVDSMLFGCLLALVGNPMEAEKPTRPMSLAQWALFLSGVALLGLTLAIRSPLFRETLRYTLQGIALWPIFYFAIRYPSNPLFRGLNGRWIMKIGVYSYAIYLIHYTVVHAFLAGTRLDRYPWALLALVFGISMLYAFLIDRFVDPPFKRLRKRYH